MSIYCFYMIIVVVFLCNSLDVPLILFDDIYDTFVSKLFYINPILKTGVVYSQVAVTSTHSSTLDFPKYPPQSSASWPISIQSLE